MDRVHGPNGDGAVDTDEVERLRRAVDEEKQQRLRLLADFDNFRRRTARGREIADHDGRREALLPLLPVLDTLARAPMDGVAATHRLFLSELREAGAAPVESTGRSFAPRVHEAVATVPANGAEPGTVAREARRGWRLGDDLLRPAQVVVAIAPEPAARWR